MVETDRYAQNKVSITSSTQRDTSQKLSALRIKALRGKYRQALTPSDEFARQKRGEIVQEREVT